VIETDGPRGPRRSVQSSLALLLTLGSLSGSILHAASDSRYGQIPLVFIANRGQVHHSVRFTAKSQGFSAYFTPEEVVIDVASTVVRMRYPGANVSPTLGGLDLQEGKANYLIGNEPANWQTDVPLFGRVIYKDLYPGIDMLYSSSTRRLKSEFIVAPGADPSRIQIAYTGVASIRIDDAGALIFNTPDGELREAAPEIYQEANSRRGPVEGAFRVAGNVVSFLVGEYDHSRELRIDPVLSYSTYLGGNGTNKGTAIAVDSSNSAYVTGYTDSTNFPVTGGAAQTASGGSVDAFVTKLNVAGSAIVYSTYIGGSGDDRGFSIAVDGSGNAYVTGWTSSMNFPVVAAAQPGPGGGRDAFVAKLNPAGSALIFSTYLGGVGTDSGNGIAIDGSGVYVTGSTTSTNFPVANPVQAALSGGQDGFVTKLNAAGNIIVYSTYLGGLLDDRGSSIAVDSSGSAYVAGNTNSSNFPVAGNPNPLQVSYGGGTDAFVAKLGVTGNPLIYSTYLGGSGIENVEVGTSIAVDSAGSAYVTGMTSSTNFPTFQPLQGSLGGSNDAFVVKLNAAGTAFVYSTFLGGSSIDYGESIAIDSGGYAYIGGYTASTDFPSVNADQPVIGGGYDAFIARLNPAGSALTDTDFLGGSGADAGYGIALDTSAAAYLTGSTSSSNFPLRTPAQGSLGTNTLAAFVAKFTFGSNGALTPVSVSPASGSGTSQTFTLLYSDPSGYTDINWVNLLFQTQINGQNACWVQYTRATNIIDLIGDSGSGSTSATLGTTGTLTNSQCTIDTGASSVSTSGSLLTLTVALSFKPVFAGAKNVYMGLFNNALVTSGWQSRGVWTAAGSLPPTNVSVSPASGSGTTQMFSFVYSDPSGYADINWVNMLFQTQINGQNACWAQYTLASNTIGLVSDSGAGSTSAPLGTLGVLSNSQCTLDTGASSGSVSGNNLTITVALTFKPAFAGSKNIYMGVFNKAIVNSGWQAKGAWTVTGVLPPSNVSVSPASGAGYTQTFTSTYSDPSGFADINWVNVLFQTQLTGQSACWLQYTLANNAIYLVNDSGSGYTSATLGTAGTLSNSQCIVDTGASSASGSGNSLTFSASVTFKPAFAGAKNIYMSVFNNSTVTSGWQVEGTWTANSQPPSNVSVTPSSGTGTTQNFTFIYSDPYGHADISWVNMLFQSQLTGQNACWVQYTPATNAIDLVGDSGSGSTSNTLGTVGTLSNSQCSVDTGLSSMSTSGNNLTVTAAVTFKPAFTGAKNIYMSVFTNLNLSSGWQINGTWTH
jgi:hypothetical protein